MRPSGQTLAMLFVLALLYLAMAAPAGAVPGLITYQGALTDAAGSPANGAFGMTFEMYRTATGGAPVWAETVATVKVNDGVFTVILGGGTPLPDGLLNCNFLQVSVGGTALLPRQRLTSVPYALEATNSRLLGGQSRTFYQNASSLVAGTLRLGRLPRIPTSKLAPNAVTSSRIATAAVTTAKIAPGAVTGDRVLDGSLTGADLAAVSVTAAQISRTGLDADLLDGQDSSAFAGAGHGHDLGALTGQVGTAQIADSAVTAAKIDVTGLDADTLDGQDSTAFADTGHGHDLSTLTGQVGTAQIADSAVTSAQIAADTITESDIAYGAVRADEIAFDAVVTGKIKAGTAVSGSLSGGGVLSAVNTNAGSGSAGLLASSLATSGSTFGVLVTANLRG